MTGAIKVGHIPGTCPTGYYRAQDESLKIDNSTKDIVLRIFELYLEEKSYQQIANIYNEEKVLYPDLYYHCETCKTYYSEKNVKYCIKDFIEEKQDFIESIKLIIKQFFEIAYQYYIFYSKNDFQFTNAIYLYADKNLIIAENLQKLHVFKAYTRVWINDVATDELCGQVANKENQKK